MMRSETAAGLYEHTQRDGKVSEGERRVNKSAGKNFSIGFLLLEWLMKMKCIS